MMLTITQRKMMCRQKINMKGNQIVLVPHMKTNFKSKSLIPFRVFSPAMDCVQKYVVHNTNKFLQLYRGHNLKKKWEEEYESKMQEN